MPALRNARLRWAEKITDRPFSEKGTNAASGGAAPCVFGTRKCLSAACRHEAAQGMHPGQVGGATHQTRPGGWVFPYACTIGIAIGF